MNKTCVISCPISTYSGYGARSRDLVKAIIRQYPDWDVKILAQRWGDTRQCFLDDHPDEELSSRIITRLESEPDVWMQITVPNEFQAVGKINIGVTAGIEATLCDSSWIQGCNRMDLVLVSSEHSKAALINSRYSQQKSGETLKVDTEIEVLFEGIDPKVYWNYSQTNGDVPSEEVENFMRNTVKTKWNFLCVGHWLKGDFGQDRKNIAYTIKMFLETFKDREDAPGLILKVSGGITGIPDRYNILDKIYRIQNLVQYSKSLPKIYLLHGDLADYEMNQLYNDPKVKCLVSFTKGEGYGRPLAEFAAIGKPVLCSGWSGQVDFLDQQYTAFVGGTLEKIHPSAVVKETLIPEASWFTPDDKSVQTGLEALYRDYNFWLNKAKKQAKIINSKKSIAAMQDALAEIFTRYEIDG